MKMLEDEKSLWYLYYLENAQIGFWKIGPLKLWIKRLAKEFDIVFEHSHDSEDRAILIEVPFQGKLPVKENTFRFSFNNSYDCLSFSPSLPNRALVFRPENPFYVIGGESTTIYVSSGLWLNIKCTEDNKNILEIPIVKLTDTWFGEDPTSGEVCYASRTKAKLELDDMKIYQYRFLTKINIVNQSDEPIKLARIKLPSKFLSLYMNAQGMIVTDTITVIKSDSKGGFKLEFHPPEKEDFGTIEKIVPAKETFQKNILSKTLSRVIG